MFPRFEEAQLVCDSPESETFEFSKRSWSIKTKTTAIVLFVSLFSLYFVFVRCFFCGFLTFQRSMHATMDTKFNYTSVLILCARFLVCACLNRIKRRIYGFCFICFVCLIVIHIIRMANGLQFEDAIILLLCVWFEEKLCVIIRATVTMLAFNFLFVLKQEHQVNGYRLHICKTGSDAVWEANEMDGGIILPFEYKFQSRIFP